jgi:hypothetical protein
MTVQLLLTDEIKATMPETINVLFNYGRIQVRFPALNGNDKEALMMFGDNAVLEGDADEFVKWLKPFDGIAVGNGVPQMESFSIMHIDENL